MKKNYFNNEIILANLNNEEFLLKEFIKFSKKLLYSMKEFKYTPEQNKKEMIQYNSFRAVSNSKTCETPNYLRFNLKVSKNIFAFWETIILNNFFKCCKNIGRERKSLMDIDPRQKYYFEEYDFDLTEKQNNNISDVIVQDDSYMIRASELKNNLMEKNK
jgi:hypothetical protein